MKVNGKSYWTRNPKFVFRDAEWILLFRSGKTLQEIGDQYGVTRERVRQRFAKLGLNADCGGYALHALTRARARTEAQDAAIAARERRIRGKYGVSLADWKSIGSWARKAFSRQRQTAINRGIQWGLSLYDWWRIWQESGHWAERGRGAGYCMARWADDGPYSAENVYICTNSENVKHGYIINTAAMRTEKRRKTLEAKHAAS